MGSAPNGLSDIVIDLALRWREELPIVVELGGKLFHRVCALQRYVPSLGSFGGIWHSLLDLAFVLTLCHFAPILWMKKDFF